MPPGQDKSLYWKAFGLFIVFFSPCQAEVVFDGSLGDPGTLSGDFEIPAAQGELRGSNLFHSFSVFDIDAGETATFTGPPSVENILSRVTGGDKSNIDGTLRTDFPDAAPDFFLINPAGIVFGPNAALDVQGSFHVSTADFIQLEDGMLFSASLSGQAPLLSTAPPEAFGFLDNNVGGIEVQDANLEIPAEQAFSLIGGEVIINDGSLIAPSGVVNIAAAGGEGMISFKDGQIHIPEEQPRHSITLENAIISTIVVALGEFGVADTASANANAQEGPAQRIMIEAENLTLNNTALLSPAQGSQPGGDVIIKVPGHIQMTGGFIDSSTFSSADAGNIFIISGSLNLNQAALLQTGSSGVGQPGDIAIKVKGDVTLANSALFSSFQLFRPESAEGSVTSGDVFIESKNLTLRSEGGGATTVQSDSFSSSSGGQISFKVEEAITLTGDHTFVTSDAFGEGDAGSIEIKSGRLVVSESAEISARTSSAGKGGSVEIEAVHIQVSQGGLISAESLGSGESGDLSLRASDSLQLFDGGEISVAALNANAGSITLQAGGLLLLRDNSRITTLVQGGEGRGGNIVVEGPLFLVLDATSKIRTQVVGGGGNILIAADFFLGAIENVTSSSKQSISSSPDIVSGTVQLLPPSRLETAGLLDITCAARIDKNASRFVIKGRAGISPEPDMLLPAQPSDLQEGLIPPSSGVDVKALPVAEIEASNSISAFTSHARGCYIP